MFDKPRIDAIIKVEGVRPVTGISDGPRTLFYSKKRAVTFVFLFYIRIPKNDTTPPSPCVILPYGLSATSQRPR